MRPGAIMAGRVLDRKSGAGRPPGPRAAALFSGLHSMAGVLFSFRCCFFFLKAFFTLKSKKAARSMVRPGEALSPLDILRPNPPNTISVNRVSNRESRHAFPQCALFHRRFSNLTRGLVTRKRGVAFAGILHQGRRAIFSPFFARDRIGVQRTVTPFPPCGSGRALKRA